MRLIRKAKRGCDKELHRGMYYTAATYAHDNQPTRVFIRLQDEDGNTTHTVEMSAEEASEVARNFAQYVATHERHMKGGAE